MTSENNVARIDLLSIDVEGAEFEVITSMDWTIPIYVIVIELNDQDNSDLAAQKRLVNSGYVFFKNVGRSKIYIDPHYFRKLRI